MRIGLAWPVAWRHVASDPAPPRPPSRRFLAQMAHARDGETANHSAHARHASPAPAAAYRPVRYPLNQYDRSPCANLGLAGNVCPIVLGCAVLRPWLEHGASSAEGRAPAPAGSTCPARGLGGLGFNPSIVPAPPAVRAAASRFGDVHYVAADRFEWTNPQVRCGNRDVGPSAGGAHNHSATRLFLLDRQFRVLYRRNIYGGSCAQGRNHVTDTRLIAARGASKNSENATLWASYVVDWGNASCIGHWLGRIAFEDLGPKRMRRVVLEPTEAFGGVDLLGEPNPLLSRKNGGVLVGQDGTLTHELVDVAPLQLRSAAGVITTPPMPPTFPRAVHNSAHPLWITALRGYLGVGHRHFTSGADGKGRYVQGSPFRRARSEQRPSSPRRVTRRVPRIGTASATATYSSSSTQTRAPSPDSRASSAFPRSQNTTSRYCPPPTARGSSSSCPPSTPAPASSASATASTTASRRSRRSPSATSTRCSSLARATGTGDETRRA